MHRFFNIPKLLGHCIYVVLYRSTDLSTRLSDLHDILVIAYSTEIDPPILDLTPGDFGLEWLGCAGCRLFRF